MVPQRNGQLATTLVLLIALVALPIGAIATGHNAEGPEFAVEIIETDGSVIAGEPLSVTAVVTNTGTERGSQQIHLKGFDSAIVDSVAGPPLTLAPGEQQTVSLSWNTTAAAVGTGNVSVQSNDAYPTTEVTVEPVPDLRSELGTVNSTTEAGDTLTVPVTVINSGNESATLPVWMELNGSRTATTSTEVAPGTTERVVFNHTTDKSDVGRWNLTAGINASQDTTTVTVKERATATPEPDQSTSDTTNGTAALSSDTDRTGTVTAGSQSLQQSQVLGIQRGWGAILLGIAGLLLVGGHIARTRL